MKESNDIEDENYFFLTCGEYSYFGVLGVVITTANREVLKEILETPIEYLGEVNSVYKEIKLSRPRDFESIISELKKKGYTGKSIIFDDDYEINLDYDLSEDTREFHKRSKLIRIGDLK